MQILSVYFKHQPGGFTKRLYQVLAALAQNNHTVHYVAVRPYPLTLPGIEAHILPLPFRERENPLFWILFTVLAPIYCAWIARTHKIKSAVVFSSFYAFICAPAVVLADVKLVTFLRADVLREARFEQKPKLKMLVHRVLEWWGLKFSKRVIANSQTLADAVSKRCRHVSPVVLPNHIDVSFAGDRDQRVSQRRRYDLTDAEFTVATASPLNRVKNIDFLIKAFALAQLRPARLLIIGEDVKKTGERQRLEQLTAALTLQGQVVFTGWLQQPQHLIAACDLFVFPSYQEGSPNALLEALACRIPCLGSRIPEIAEILHYDDLMFDLGSPYQLAEKIKKSAADADFRKHLTKLVRLREKVYSFDWETAAVKLITT